MSRRALPYLIALAAVAHAATFLGYGPCDDDFIAYRYARNWVEGAGLVFNPGERVEGFSAPGWTLAVAAALRLGVEAPVFSVVASMLASGVAAFAIARLWARRHPDDPWHAPALLVAASPAIAWHAILGLGTLALAALLAVWLDLWDGAVRRGARAWSAAAVLGLAALVRNEAVLLALPFALHEWRRERGAAVPLAFLPLAAWQLFRLAYYGRMLPMTYTLKKLPFFDDLRFGLEYLATASASTGIVVALALSFVLFSRRAAAAGSVLRATAAGVVLFALYVVYVGGDFLPHGRFFVPLLPLAFLLACEGFLTLFGTSRAACAGGLAVALALLQVPQLDRAFLLETHQHAEPRWGAIGREVARRVPPSTKVAISPIGAFGYESRLYVVDMLGLTNTEVAKAPPDVGMPLKGHQRSDAEWVLAQRPELVVLGETYVPPDGGAPTMVVNHWERSLLEHPRFLEEYEPLRLEVTGSYPLIAYWRRGVPPPAGVRTR